MNSRLLETLEGPDIIVVTSVLVVFDTKSIIYGNVDVNTKSIDMRN